MIRSPAEISTIMPTVESSTRIEYSKMRRDWSPRYSIERISVAAEPVSARIFRNLGEVVDDEAAAEGLAGRQPQFQRAGHDQQAHRQPRDKARGLRPAIGTQHQQHHRAQGQNEFRQHGQQLITCTLKAHGALSC